MYKRQGYILYLSLFKLLIILVADVNEISCSVDLPPNIMANLIIFSRPLFHYILYILFYDIIYRIRGYFLNGIVKISEFFILVLNKKICHSFNR